MRMHDLSCDHRDKCAIIMKGLHELEYVQWHGGGAAAPIAVPHAPGAAGPAAEDEGDAPAPEPAVVPCEVCAAGAAKYKCPRCVVQTCSLACATRRSRSAAGCATRPSTAA